MKIKNDDIGVASLLNGGRVHVMCSDLAHCSAMAVGMISS